MRSATGSRSKGDTAPTVTSEPGSEGTVDVTTALLVMSVRAELQRKTLCDWRLDNKTFTLLCGHGLKASLELFKETLDDRVFRWIGDAHGSFMINYQAKLVSEHLEEGRELTGQERIDWQKNTPGVPVTMGCGCVHTEDAEGSTINSAECTEQHGFSRMPRLFGAPYAVVNRSPIMMPQALEEALMNIPRDEKVLQTGIEECGCVNTLTDKYLQVYSKHCKDGHGANKLG